MTTAFSITWDYRCPFARIANLHVIEGLRDGADWDVTFVPFSLGQAHVAEGQTDIWDRPDDDSGLLALQAGVVVRDRFPDLFLAAHEALFAARHEQGLDLRDPDVVAKALTSAGVDAQAVLDEIARGQALATVRREHEAAVLEHDVWGVPTFIAGDHAAFVRLMDAPDGDRAGARTTVERIIDLLDGWPALNEFKHTTVTR